MHHRLWSSFFLLVTVFSRHLALAAPPTRRSPSSSEEQQEPSSSASPSSPAASVVWSSPVPGDRFGPGDVITGEWQVVTAQKIVSPSFRLCAGGDDGCGATVWPQVVDQSAGHYSVSLTAPNVTTESGYYLQMKDDFGHAYTSPIFKLTPTPQKKNEPAGSPPPQVAQPRPRPDQAPMSSSSSSSPSSHGTKSNGATYSDPAAAAAAEALPAPPADPGGPTDTTTTSGGTQPNSAGNLTPASNGNGNSGGRPLVAAAHSAPPTAAIAIPLCLTAAIVLLAGGLALHHRRQLAAERARCGAQLAATTSSGKDADADDASSESAAAAARSLRPVGLALDLGRRISSRISRANYHRRGEKASESFFPRAGFFPDHVYHDAVCHHHDRRPEVAAALDPSHSYNTPSYHYAHAHAHGAPEPRLRTRQLDLLTREFTTTSTSTRRRAHPSYRGIFGNRHSVRRSGSDNGGPSSLWRSLSIARRKAAPPSAFLASPALTESVVSVTSEVLPSYLPSPNFVGAAPHVREHEHGPSTDDLGFENVPLSPPPPPPLHTRGEAVEPDDSRMRELRGVYEAVAHALGNVRRV